MTEDEACGLVESLVGGAAIEKLERLGDLVVAENSRQNLISSSTVPQLWTRHILDSVQLLRWATPDGVWIDIGTGGGFPGLAIASIRSDPMILVEPRRRRAEFLSHAAAALDLDHVRVFQHRAERVVEEAAIISARAVTSIDQLFDITIQCSTAKTRWLMPRGSHYDADMSLAKTRWEASFHVEQSLSDPTGRVVIATEVKRA